MCEPRETVPDEVDAGDGNVAATTRRRARQSPGEIGGPAGPEPTRYGDWERNGRVSDF